MYRFILILCVFFTALTQAAPGLSPRTYNQLTEIQEGIDEVKDGEEGAAEKLLDIDEELNEMVEDLVGSPLGLALALQTQAQLKVRMEKTIEAIALLKRATAITDIEDNTRNQLKMFLAQLLFTTEQYRDVLAVLEPWLQDKDKSKPAGAYAMLAATYYTLENLSAGLPYIELAVELSKTPKEPWIQMAFSGNYQIKNFPKALSYLDQLVYSFPDKKDYWNQKAGVLQMLERYEEAAAVKELAYKRGFIESEAEFVNLGQLLASQGAAFKVAGILESALVDKVIAPSDKVLNLAYQAWLQAKEIEKATRVLAELYRFGGQADDGIRLVQFHVDAENWQLAHDVTGQLLNQELDSQQLAGVNLYKGISLYRLGKTEEAIAALKKSTAEKKTAQQAKAWINYIKTLSQA